MKPKLAWFLLNTITALVGIIGMVAANSFFKGDFWAGVLVFILPTGGVYYLLPHLLPARCPRCGMKMAFKFVKKRMDSIAPAAERSKSAVDYENYHGFVCPNCSEQSLEHLPFE